MAQMACNVYVLTEEGEPLLLAAGTAPPEWALAQLGEHTIILESEAPHGSDDEVAVPPMKGPGSSAAAWAAYAHYHGYATDADAKASEIRDALAADGVPIR